MQIALFLTLGRLLLGPFFLVFYLYHSFLGISQLAVPYILIFLLILSELSDFFDGFLARKWDQVTELGKILDPMADSIARISVFLTFTQGLIQLPLLLVFVFLYRDSLISTLRTLCALRGVALAARISGKIKAVVQAIASFIIVVLMIPFTLGMISQQMIQLCSLYVVSAAAAYTLFSGMEYIYANRFYIKKAWNKS